MKRLKAIIRLLFSKDWIIVTSQSQPDTKNKVNDLWAIDFSDHYKYPSAAPADVMVEYMKMNLFYTISTLRIEADRLERSWYSKAR